MLGRVELDFHSCCVLYCMERGREIGGKGFPDNVNVDEAIILASSGGEKMTCRTIAVAVLSCCAHMPSPRFVNQRKLQ